MSTWTTPATFTAAAVTVATANTEIRDHLLFLKGALDVLTDSTTADTGAAMYLSVTRASGVTAFRTLVTADTQPRLNVVTTGDLNFSSGAAVTDVRLRRDTTSRLSIDNAAGSNTFSFDTGANPFFLMPSNGYIYWQEAASAPAAPAANEARMFCRDNGAGKTQLAVIFPTGAVQVIATEP